MREEISKNGSDSAKALITSLNIMGCEQEFIKSFVEQVLNQHRTKQQALGRLIFAILEAWAKSYEIGYFDGRNEDICKLSHKIMKSLEQEDLYLPLI